MSAGSGGMWKFPSQVIKVETMREADYRTALAIAHATARAWEAIATARGQTVTELKLALDRYQRRSPN